MRARVRARPGGVLLAGALLLAAACGGAGSRATGSSLAPDVITPDEIAASSATNAYDLISQVRPNWLRGRGTPSFRNPAAELPLVYLEDRRQGGLDVLRSFATNTLASLRYINGTTATTRFGMGHAGGVIEIVLKKR
jgi:hypothetical protein